MIEAVVALAGLIVCWFLAAMTYSDDMSLTQYAWLTIVGVFALYFLVRLVHWAWVTPIPFAGHS